MMAVCFVCCDCDICHFRVECTLREDVSSMESFIAFACTLVNSNMQVLT